MYFGQVFMSQHARSVHHHVENETLNQKKQAERNENANRSNRERKAKPKENRSERDRPNTKSIQGRSKPSLHHLPI